jgi:uncharacterized repeat protein (TIGR01451 family)
MNLGEPPNNWWQSCTNRLFDSLAPVVSKITLTPIVCVMLALLSGTAYAGSISGYKFLDSTNTGNGVIANGVRDDQDPLLENHMIILKQNNRKLTEQLTDDNGHFSFPNLSDGKYQLSINIPRGACSTAPKLDNNTAHSRNINYDVTIKHSQNRRVDIGVATKGCKKRPPQPCKKPSFTSQRSGRWDDSAIWSTGRVPSGGDKVKVAKGHVVTMPAEMVNLGTGGLCNEGSIISDNNTRQFGTSDIEIHARVIKNSGSIKGQDGVNGICSVRGVSASNIMLFASGEFVNETTDMLNEALISTGDGGTSYGWNNHPWLWKVCPEHWNIYAGNGGGIEIKAGVIKNYSNVVAGNGGNAGIAYHGAAYAGEGGYIVVSSDNVNDSVNTGVITTGRGGWSRGYRNGTRYSSGGNVIVNLADFNGEIVGAPGSSLWGDPINLNLGADLKIRDFESVNLYTDEGGTIDFTKVNENTFSNIKVISIATKSLNGEGGSIDLRGISGKIFKAAEKVEIFADNIQLDAGVDIRDLIEAPEVVIEKGKLIYHVQLSSDRQIVGEPNSTVTIPVKVFNASPKDDSYTFTVTDSAGWTLGTIAEVAVKGLQYANVTLPVTLPSERAATNEITITATSKTKSDVTAEAKIHAMVNAGEDSDGDGHPDVLDQFPDDAGEWLDTDSDGEGDNADTDDDNDGMLDTWEEQYEGLISVIDDAEDDLDEDGFSNLAESQAETDPTDSGSHPVVPTGDYTAYGTIRDELGNKLAGVEVQVAGKTVTTDAAGNWEVSNLPEGEYTVTVSKDGYTFAPENVALGNDEFRQESVLKPLSNLKVKVVAEPRTVKQDDNVTYIATVINGGAETATGVVLTDTLPANAGGLISIETLDGGQCDANTVTCTLPDLTTGNSARVKFVVSNTQAKSLLNTATVTANEYPADVQKTRTRVIPHLAVSITDTPEPLQLPVPGEARVLHYDVATTLSANAPSAATGVKLVMTLPKGVELQAVNSDNGMCDTSELPIITCSMTDLSVASVDDVSQITVGIDVVLKDAGLLALMLEAKVSANEYPVHQDKERTSIFIEPKYKVGMAFVIDDSGSMQSEINSVKAAINDVIDEILTTGDTPPLSVLLTFGDQVKYRAVTQDMTVLRDAVAKLKASGGGTCPEASFEAISFAIPHLNEGGTILFATDASAYEGSDTEDMMARLRSNGIVFNAMLFGDCSDENSWNQPDAE